MRDNRGSVDVNAWVVGIIGFTVTYFVWVFTAPAISQLKDIAVNGGLNLPAEALAVLPTIEEFYEWGLIFNAAVWLIYIVYSSIREEVESSVRIR